MHGVVFVGIDLKGLNSQLANPQALILGCSHAAGSEMHLEVNGNDDRYGYSRSYPALIAQGLGYRIQNFSIPGGSNDAMFRIFESKYQELVPERDIVIACWTGNHRTEVWNNEDQIWLQFGIGTQSWHKQEFNQTGESVSVSYSTISNQAEYLLYCKYWGVYGTDAETGRLNKLKNIIALNNMAENYGIKVLNFHSFSPVQTSQYFWPADGTEFCDWCTKQNFIHTKNGHFYYDAHDAFAKYILTGLN